MSYSGIALSSCVRAVIVLRSRRLRRPFASSSAELPRKSFAASDLNSTHVQGANCFTSKITRGKFPLCAMKISRDPNFPPSHLPMHSTLVSTVAAQAASKPRTRGNITYKRRQALEDS